MSPQQSRQFFLIAATVLGRGARKPVNSGSWCGWTTFTLLKQGVHYLERGLPGAEDIEPLGLKDGGLWGQAFRFDDLAHIVIPRTFFWESEGAGAYSNGLKSQNLEALSEALKKEGIPHTVTELVLEIKLY